MVFSSSVFLFVFLPTLLSLYFIAADKFRNAILLVFSLVFYAWGEPKNVFLMIATIVAIYLLGFAAAPTSKFRKTGLAVAIARDLAALFVFKYQNFAVDTANTVFGTAFAVRRIALPIGISFYTFQIMSYVIDVYKGVVKPQRNIFDLALYVSLFPQLIAGPIVRYIDVEKQIAERKASWDGAAYGLSRFATGFSKKVLVADQLAPLADICFSGTYPSAYLNWAGMVAYSLQIYYDFSGYSDMAIGLGKVFGFDFLENFNYPYVSRSIQEFWRRWHISLSTWFRDYVYIPLGGNRAGTARTYLNLVIVFFLTGLWHGASFSFIFWGLFHGAFLITERVGLRKALEKCPKAVGHVYSLFAVMIAWVFFRADTLAAALHYIRGLFSAAGDKDMVNFVYVMNRQYWFFIVAGIVCALPHSRLKAKLTSLPTWPAIGSLLTIAIFLLAVCYMIGSGYSPFLYFRF